MTDQADAIPAGKDAPFRKRVQARDLTRWSIIEAEIQKLGVSRARIMRMAGLSEHAIVRGLKRDSRPRRGTRMRLAEALRQVAMRRQKGWL